MCSLPKQVSLEVITGVTQVLELLEHWERPRVPSLESMESMGIPSRLDTALSRAPPACAICSGQMRAGRMAQDPAWEVQWVTHHAWDF